MALMYYYCSILLQHVLSLIYMHPWHHICLLRITYPDLSLFYFSVTWLFKWSCGLVTWLYRLATDCLSESNDVGVFRGGASVGVGGLEIPPYPKNSIVAPTSPSTNLRRKKERMGGGRRKKNRRAPLELNPASTNRCVCYRSWRSAHWR